MLSFKKSQTHREMGTESHGSYGEKIAGLPSRHPGFFCRSERSLRMNGVDPSAARRRSRRSRKDRCHDGWKTLMDERKPVLLSRRGNLHRIVRFALGPAASFRGPPSSGAGGCLQAVALARRLLVQPRSRGLLNFFPWGPSGPHLSTYLSPHPDHSHIQAFASGQPAANLTVLHAQKPNFLPPQTTRTSRNGQ
jgi:hypothetical protein